MNSNKNQKGLTLISLLIIVVISLFIGVTAVKLVPFYIENFSVKSSLESIAADINADKIKPKDIKSRLLKRLNMSNITRITQNEIEISGGGVDSKLSVEYEVRLPFLANIDFMVKFSNSEIIHF